MVLRQPALFLAGLNQDVRVIPVEGGAADRSLLDQQFQPVVAGGAPRLSTEIASALILSWTTGWILTDCEDFLLLRCTNLPGAVPAIPPGGNAFHKEQTSLPKDKIFLVMNRLFRKT
jgi:hypothetical protein